MMTRRWTLVGAAAGVLLGTCGIGCKKRPASGRQVGGGTRALSAASTNARTLPPALAGLALSPAGAPWVVGSFARPFDLGANVIAPSGETDIYLARLDPSTCQATAAFVFGDGAGNEQRSSGVAVAAKGNVGLIGQFTAQIDFTANQPNGSGPGGKPSTAGVDFLRSGSTASRTSFYSVIDGASQGSQVTPIKAHMVDTGFGSLLAVGSHPGHDAFVICGRTSDAVPQWSDSGNNRGIITGARAVAGGDMDILVAKIDAATGAVRWGRQFGGAGSQVCEAATLDGNGDVVIAGWYSGALAFDGVPLPGRSMTDALLYVAKLSGASGAGIAAATWGKTGRSNAPGIAVDASNNIIVGGTLGASIDFGGGLTVVNEGWMDAFVVKLTPTLAPVWAKSFGDAHFDQVVNRVGVTAQGDVILAGSFTGKLGALQLTSSGKGEPDAFMARLAAADGAVLFARAYGDADGGQAISTLAIARTGMGARGEVFVGGGFTGSIDFGSTVLRVSDPGSLASFIARLSP